MIAASRGAQDGRMRRQNGRAAEQRSAAQVARCLSINRAGRDGILPILGHRPLPRQRFCAPRRSGSLSTKRAADRTFSPLDRLVKFFVPAVTTHVGCGGGCFFSPGRWWFLLCGGGVYKQLDKTP